MSLTAVVLLSSSLVSACGAGLDSSCSDWGGFGSSDKKTVEQKLLDKFNYKDSGFKELAAGGVITIYCRSAGGNAKISNVGQSSFH